MLTLFVLPQKCQPAWTVLLVACRTEGLCPPASADALSINCGGFACCGVFPAKGVLDMWCSMRQGSSMPINIPMMGRGASGDPAGGVGAAGRAATFIPPHLLDQQRVRARAVAS